MILIDTHVWLWWLMGDGALSKSQREELDRLASKNELALSWVSIWETEILERKGRIQLKMNFDEWIKKATSPSFLKVIGVDTNLVLYQRKLPKDFHSDPADRLIVTTAMALKIPLATFDRKIIDSKAVEIWA